MISKSMPLALALSGLCFLPAASAQDSDWETVRLKVKPKQTVRWNVPVSQGIQELSITVNGRDAIYERVTGCRGYFYWRGVVGRMSDCRSAHRRFRVRIVNADLNAARVKIRYK